MSRRSRGRKSYLTDHLKRSKNTVRILDFGPKDEGKRYLICYQALCFSKAELPRNELRAHGKVLTILESIGEVANPDRKEAETMLYRSPGGGKVVLENSEYELLKRFVVGFIPDMHRSLSREMDRTVEWLEAIPEQARPAVDALPATTT